jgi:hypothetical protein
MRLSSIARVTWPRTRNRNGNRDILAPLIEAKNVPVLFTIMSSFTSHQ